MSQNYENKNPYQNLFKDFSIVAELTKPHSPNVLRFLSDPRDPFMISQVTYRVRSGNIITYSLIIEPDLKQRITRFLKDGYALIPKRKEGCDEQAT